MKIYFACSIRGGREDQATYHRLIEHFKTFGEVFSEHDDASIKLPDEDAGIDSNQHIFKRDMAWLHAADVLVAEVSTPSLGVGYELAFAEVLEIPTICFYRFSGKHLSAMVRGNPYFSIKEYQTIEEINTLLEWF